MGELIGIVELSPCKLCLSISSVDVKHARTLPCVFQDSVCIDLCPAGPETISHETLRSVIVCLLRFKCICRDYGASSERVRVALQSFAPKAAAELSSSIEQATHWKAAALDAEQECMAGPYGVAYNFHEAQGLYLDIGLNVIHLNWVSFAKESRVGTAPLELRYGPELIEERLKKCPEDAIKLREEFRNALNGAIDQIQPPAYVRENAQRTGGYRLYVRGEGVHKLKPCFMRLRLASLLPTLNGVVLNVERVRNLINLFKKVSKEEARLETEKESWEKLLWLVFMMSVVIDELADINEVLYCYDSFRECLLFLETPPEIRAQDPLIVATSPYALPGAAKLADKLKGCLPPSAPGEIVHRLVPALANSAYIHSSYPRSMQTAAGLTVAISGVLSGCQCISQDYRILLGLALCNRWGGEMESTAAELREELISFAPSRHLAWWALYVGHVLHLLGGTYPGAHVRDNVISLVAKDPVNGSKEIELEVKANRSSIHSHNIVVCRRLDQFPVKVERLAKKFGKDATPLSINVVWEEFATSGTSSCNSPNFIL